MAIIDFYIYLQISLNKAVMEFLKSTKFHFVFYKQKQFMITKMQKIAKMQLF